MWAGYRNQIKRWRMWGLSMGILNLVVFLFRDDFLTDETAPLTSPRTAEPGPGIGKVVDTGNVLDISGGEIVPNAAITGDGDPAYLENGGIARAAGLAAYFNVRNYSALGSASNSVYLGWPDDSTPIITDMDGIGFGAASNLIIVLGGSVNGIIGTYVNNTFRKLFVILRDSGFFFVDQDNEVLLYITDAETTTPVFATVIGTVPTRAPFGLSTLRIAQLPAPWNTDDGIATSTLDGARSAGDTFTHEADFLGEFTVTTVPTVGTIFYSFRRQDANNYWEVIVEPNQDITLREVVASVPTARGTAAGVINNGDRVVIVADGTTIRVYDQNVLRITYAAAVNFQTETDGEVLGVGDGVMSDLKQWPRVLSGAALSALNRIANTV